MPLDEVANLAKDLIGGPVVTRMAVRGTISMNLIRRACALVVAPAVAALVTLAVSACSVTGTPSPTQTYREHGVSFDYPAGWVEEDLPAPAASSWLWRIKIGPGTGGDLIIVEVPRLGIPLGAGNLAGTGFQLEPSVRHFFAHEGGAMHAGPQRITVGGLPGLRFQGTGTRHAGTVIGYTLVFVFNGTTDYIINCQHTRAYAGEMQRACSLVMDTFKAGRPPPPPAGTQSYRADGVSFAYPAALHEGALARTVGNGRRLWAVSLGLDTEDWIGIGADRLPAPVTAAGLAAYTPAAGKAARRFFGRARGVVQAGPQQIRLGGLPALQFGGTATIQGITLKVSLVFAFDRTTQYFLYCAHTQAAAGQMQRACSQVMHTFKVSKAT